MRTKTGKSRAKKPQKSQMRPERHDRQIISSFLHSKEWKEHLAGKIKAKRALRRYVTRRKISLTEADFEVLNSRLFTRLWGEP